MTEAHQPSAKAEAPPEQPRGIPSVNDDRISHKRRGLIFMALLVFVLVLAGLFYWKQKLKMARETEATQQRTLELQSSVPARTFTKPTPTPAEKAQPSKTIIVPAPDTGVAVLSGPAGQPTPAQSGTTASSEAKPQAALDKSASALMAVTGKAPDKPEKLQPDTRDQADGQGGLRAMLSSTRTAGQRAQLLGDRNFILAKGSFIDCALQTKLDSTVPGMTACVLTRNIYSDNGKVLLLERGSTVTGEYQSNMRQGMARIFVLWNRIKTPTGVVIPLDSPGTDPLGGAGIPGTIDTHFWQRFGGALMLSLLDDVARGVANTQSSQPGQQNFNFNSTGETTQNMAAEALKNTINIPPTLYKNQGEQVGIYVARDLDFSTVYDVAAQ